MQESYGVLADGVAVLHGLFVLFVVGGLVLIIAGWVRDWTWTRGRAFRAVHLLAIGFVVLEVWFGVPCPLTVLENHWRELALQTGYTRGYVAHWVSLWLYYDAPPWVFVVVYTVFFLLVLAMLKWHPPRWHG